MAPRMHIEIADAAKPEVDASAAQATATPSAVSTAPQASKVPTAQVRVPKAKVDAPVEVLESAAASAAVSVPTTSAPTAPKPSASAPTSAAGEPKPGTAPKPVARPQVKVAPVIETKDAADVEGTFEFADEVAGKRAAGVAGTNEPAPAGTADEGAAPRPRLGLMAWVRRTFPGHVHAFWGAVVAIVVALLTFAIGLPRMLLIAILVLIGIALGQVLDGDPKIIRTIRDLFSSDRER